jgi:zinc protease
MFSTLFSLLLATSFASDLKISFPVVKYKLENGLTVLLQEDHTVPMVSYHTWYRVGSRDEKPGVTGAAHMLEHMMFKGAKKYSGKDFDRVLHENGITNNAFTTWDYTGFYENLPSSKLELMMDMEVDRMRFLTLSPDDLKSELEVVKEERRWRIDNNPIGLLRETLFGLAYKKHPYRWPVIGTMKDITDYTSEKLKFFYDTYYVPNNAVLVLAGDIDIEKTKKLIQKYYGPLVPNPNLPQRTYPQDELPKQLKYKVVKGDVQSSTVMIAYPGVASGHPDSFPLDLLAGVLGNGDSSRLYKRLVYQAQSATSAGAYDMTNADPGLFIVSASLKPGQSATDAEILLRREVSKLKAPNAISEKELEKSKNQFMKEFVDGIMTIDGKAQALAVNEIVFGSYEKLFTDLEKYRAVTVADLERVARDYLKKERETVAILEPKNAPRPPEAPAASASPAQGGGQ